MTIYKIWVQQRTICEQSKVHHPLLPSLWQISLLTAVSQQAQNQPVLTQKNNRVNNLRFLMMCKYLQFHT